MDSTRSTQTSGGVPPRQGDRSLESAGDGLPICRLISRICTIFNFGVFQELCGRGVHGDGPERICRYG